MGYRISYYSGSAKKSKKYRTENLSMIFGLFLVAAAIAFRLSDPQTVQNCREFLLPKAQTVMVLLEELQSGGTVCNSVQAFCQEIVHGIAE